MVKNDLDLRLGLHSYKCPWDWYFATITIGKIKELSFWNILGIISNFEFEERKAVEFSKTTNRKILFFWKKIHRNIWDGF